MGTYFPKTPHYKIEMDGGIIFRDLIREDFNILVRENDINILFDFIRSLEYTTFQFIKLTRACIINLFIHVATINKGLNLNFNVYDLFFKQTSISTICTAWFRHFHLRGMF
jgi:hypothetical protein